jgi:glycosyltransferase involved in cell wall biosynthesis
LDNRHSLFFDDLDFNIGMSAPRLLYVAPEDWYFLLHRAATARAARTAGYEVHVATRVVQKGAAIEAEGFHLHPIDWRRGSLNPFHLLKTIRTIRRLFRMVAPELVHLDTLSLVALGGASAFGLDVPRVNGVVGLGTIFISRGVKGRLLRGVLFRLLPFFLNRGCSILIVENSDDAAEFGAIGVAKEKIKIVAGAPFEVGKTSILPEPEGSITTAFVGRMLADKGVRDLVNAHQRLVARGRPYRLWLVGEPDPANPTSIPMPELTAWAKLPQVEWLGYRSDIAAVWAGAHIAALPSRREGLPQSLLEAAAFGRPIVATDVPGCRDVARSGINAIAVPVDDPVAIADAIDRLAQDPDMRRRFGAAGRQLVLDEFDNERATEAMLGIYEHMLRSVGRSR